MAEELNTGKREFGPHTVVEVGKIDRSLVILKRLLPPTSFSKKILSNNLQRKKTKKKLRRQIEDASTKLLYSS